MLNVNDATKNAYMNENAPKYITISFPDGDHADITNENIVEESMKLTQSICEESTPIAGGCNSSQFEITVGDIDEDLTDKKIDVTISCKDPDYKGNWATGGFYKTNDAVKVRSDYYRCIRDTGLSVFEMKPYSADNIPSVGKVTIFEIDNAGYDLIKLGPTDSLEWKMLEIHIIQERADTSPADSLIISSGSNGSTYRYIYPDCATIRISIYDRSYGLITKALISNLKMYVLNVSDPAYTSDYWQREYGYIDTSETEDIRLFSGTIKSAKKQQNRRFKDIIAYDCIYDLANRSIRELYNEKYGIFDMHHKGEWVSGATYQKGDVVHYVKAISMGGWYTYDDAWYEYKNTSGLDKKWDPWSLYTGLYDGPCEINGKSYIEKLDSEKRNMITLKSMRDKVFSILGIKQQEVKLPFDDSPLWIKPNNETVTYATLLYYICNFNSVFGWYNPHTNQFEYIKPTLTNPYDIGKNYEMDGVVFDEKKYKSMCYVSTDEKGETVSSNGFTLGLFVEYSFIVSGYYDNADHFVGMVSNTTKFFLEFTPTSIKMVGLPFLTPGDCIRYKVDEYVKDSDGNLVEVERNIDTIVMERVLSGIQALTDEIDAKYEYE